MPFYVPISTALPQKVGGTPSAGSSLLPSANDHIHALVETLGPTNLSLGDIPDGTRWARSGASVVGKFFGYSRRAGAASNSTTTLSDWTTFALPQAGTYIIEWEGPYTTAATTTAMQVALNLTGTTSSDLQFRYVRFTAGGAYTINSSGALATKLGDTGTGPTGTQYFRCFGHISVAGAGTLALQHCSGVAASNVTISTDTFATVTQV